MTSSLHYGDNLGVLRDHIASESVDLVYLDPHFNSNAEGEAGDAIRVRFLDKAARLR